MEKSCVLVAHFDKGTPAALSTAEIKESLEGNDVTSKIEALKKAIMLLLNGEFVPQFFYSIIHYVSTCNNHTVQKFLLLYLEIIIKSEFRGEVLLEIIFISQVILDNLQSTYESVRGITLRFLCRINEPEIVEPMIPCILSNLKHRHSFIRRNAVLAVMSLYKLDLLDNAPEIVEKFLESEHDPSCKRNALLMLISCAQDRAVSYLFSNIDSIIDRSEQLQMVVLELIKKASTNNDNKNEKKKFIMIIRSLLLNANSTSSSAVVYECAATLISLTSAPTEIEAAAIAYCLLLLSQSDNNVKLIVLDRLNELKSSHREIMVVILLDLLMALSIPNNDIRRKAIDIALDLTTPKNIDMVVNALGFKIYDITRSWLHKKNEEGSEMLVKAICTCAIKFPEVASTVVHILMNFLGDSSDYVHAVDVVVSLQEIIVQLCVTALEEGEC